MLTQEENELITRVGPGTPMGNLMRHYWIPAAMSTELPAPDCPPLRLRLLCENLIAFRTTSGEIGMIADACPHRGASMFFGRNEEEGLRCVYHGWKFDVAGNCVDMPSEPAESNFKAKVKATAYPTQERSGMIWVYMGTREVPPPLPSLNANMRPEGEYHIGAYFSACNWLQSLEGDYDTVHYNFLHQGSVQFDEISPDSDEPFNRYALKTRWARHFVSDTEFGCTSGNNRPAEEGTTYWRIAQFLLPFYAMSPANFTSLAVHIVVPLDDENCIRWSLGVKEKAAPRPLSTGEAERPRVNGVVTGYVSDPSQNTTDWLGRFHPAGNRSNDWLIDRDVQRANKGPMGYSGIPGRGQDGAVTETMGAGAIYQRNKEHLGVTDAGIIRMRRLLINAARALRDNGTIPPTVDKPDLYRVTTACVVLPNGVDAFDATKDLQWKALKEAPKLEAEA